MAYDYDKMKTAYESLSKEQQKQVANQMKDNATFQQFAVDYTKERYGTGSNNTATSTPKNTNTGTPKQTVVEETTTQNDTPTPPVVDSSSKGTENTVTTTPEIKQEGALKPLSQEYYNQTSQDAQDQIVKNLNDYKKSNPEYFTDYESFKRNFSYDARDDVQKNTLDQWYKGYQDGLTLSSTPTTDLYTQYKNGDLSDAQLQNLRVSDPTKYSELMNQINTGNIVAAYDDDKGMDITGNSIQEMAYQAAQQMFMQWMSGDSSSGASQYFREYEEKMDSPEMKGLSDQCTEVQEQIENLQDDIASMKKAVEREYEGTGASRAKINAIIADRTYDLQLQLRTANSEYNKYATQYNNRMQQYQNEFQLGLQEYQINMQARNQQMSELGFAMDLMSFETPQQKSERERDYWVRQQEYTNGNINSKDYQTRYKAALSSVQNLLSQYEGIPMVRSAEEMAQDILTAIDNGSNLGKELSKINQQIQEKPEYKYLYNNTYNPSASSSNSGFGKTIKVGDMEFVEYNGNRYTADQIKQMFKGGQTGVAKAYDVVDESVFSLNTNPHTIGADGSMETTGKNLGKFLMQKANGMTGGQCGKYVNDYLEYIGMTGSKNRYYDNELSTKLNSINSYDPKVGTIAVFDYNHKSEDGVNYGHVGIVTKVTNDGIYVRDSNYSSDEKIKTRFIPKDSAEWNNNLKGFFDPSQPPLGSESISIGESISTPTLSDVDEAKKLNYLEEAKRGRLGVADTKAIGDIAAEQGWGEEWREALNQGLKIDLTETQIKRKDTADNRFFGNSMVKDFEDAAQQINSLINSLNANNGAGDLAGIFQFMKVLDPSSVVREGEFKNAAKSAGYANPEALWQNYVKHGWDGTWLTQAQRGNFKELAKELIKGQAEMYNFKYDSLKKEYADAGIDESALPDNFADFILNKLEEGNMQTSSNSFKNMTIPTVKMKNLKVTQPTQSTKSVLQSKYGLL